VNTFSPTRRQFFLWGESQARGVETSPGPVLGLRGGCARLPRQARIGRRSGAEAAAANISWASFGFVRATAADVQRTWIAGRAVMPAFAGLLLSMAIMVWPRRRW
jgi:hypothetical protein